MAQPKTETPLNGAVSTNGTQSSSTLSWWQTWEILSPPPSNTIRGSVLPKVLNRFNRHRLLTMEVHRIAIAPGSKKGGQKVVGTDPIAGANEGFDYYEECVIRILVPSKSHRNRFKVVEKESDSVPGEAVPDDASVMHTEDDSSVAGAFADVGVEESPDFTGWEPKYRLPIRTVSIKNVIKKTVTVTARYRVIKHTRELIFHSEQDAQDFAQLLETQKQAEERRAASKFLASLDGLDVKQDEELELLVEIVSGWNLPAGDLSSSDPYVVCFMNGSEVHRTKHIPKTLDPIWTVKTGSLFVMKLTAQELFSGEGLVCEIKDFDQFGKNENLGLVIVPPKLLYQGNGERMQFALSQSNGKGSLAIRCRRATDYDKKFMDEMSAERRRDMLGISAVMDKHQAISGGKGNIRSIVTLKRNKKTETSGSDHAAVTKYRVRPAPDPKRKDETKWLTKQQIEEEILNDSFHWLDTGSGSLGRLFVEVLGCDDLPNLDAGGSFGNKTDAFVALVFEDTIVKTDIIDDCLNPRWLPWSKRAFVFHIMHSSSQLYLGVFDFDAGLDDHDLIGRVSVDVSNLRRDSVYTLKYDIFPTAKMTTRKKKGSITIRLRLEVDDERKLLLSSLEPPPDLYVNVKTKKDFRVARYTCQGKYDMDAYSMKVINSYCEELLEYQQITYYIQDALESLLLWRGHFPLTIGNKSFKLPIHSMNAFLVTICLVERPELLPSFFFGSIAWVLLAIMGFRRNVPNPWRHCKSFGEFIQTLALGHSSTPPHSIAPGENAEKAAKFEEWRQKRIKEAEEAAKIAYEESAKQQEEELRELEEIGGNDTDISTKSGGGVSIDVFKPFLYPVQQYLAIACGYIRIAKNILIWEECYIAFWVTMGCVILSIASFFVPWFYIIKWSSRLIVWALFGPWMKLVDIYVVSKKKPLSEEEKSRKKAEDEQLRRERMDAVLNEARIARENATKLKEMKKIMFGRFITKVPVLKQDRHRDAPLPESFAIPYTPPPIGLAELAMKEAGYHRTRLPGQQLVGDMIPRLEAKSFTEAPTGQPTAHPSLLDKRSPGAYHSGKDSNIAAYAKIGALVVTAGLVTWFGVPLLAQSAIHVLKLR